MNPLSPAVPYPPLRWQNPARMSSNTLRQSHWNFTHQVRASTSREIDSSSGVICRSGLWLKYIKNSPPRKYEAAGKVVEFIWLPPRSGCTKIVQIEEMGCVAWIVLFQTLACRVWSLSKDCCMFFYRILIVPLWVDCRVTDPLVDPFRSAPTTESFCPFVHRNISL